MHRDLITIARELATRDPGRPKKASLARSVSRAYYALFHRLAAFCAAETIGWRHRDGDEFRRVYRSLDHGRAKGLFEELVKQPAFGKPLRFVGQAFVSLQLERHDADYDIGYKISRAVANDRIDRAEEAIDIIDRLDAIGKRTLIARLIGGRGRRSQSLRMVL